MKLIQWISPPNNIKACVIAILPLMISQVLQRLYQIVDSRYITSLGQQALIIHSIQYNFVAFGQLIGIATATSCLIFWRRKECLEKQGSILIRHLLLTAGFCIVIGMPAAIFAKQIITSYKVNSFYIHIGSVYLCIGLINMVLQALYGSLDGMLTASNQQRKSMIISAVLVIANIVIDAYAIHVVFSNNIITPQTIFYPMIIIGLSTTLFLSLACLIATYLVVKKVNGWNKIYFQEISSVWLSETGVYFIRGFIPFIFAYQLVMIISSPGFLATYQLTFHLSYIFCLPLLAAMQISVRDASEYFSQQKKEKLNEIPQWWRELFYTGLLPTFCLLIIGILFYQLILKLVYNYIAPIDQASYIPVYFFACMIGQIGNALTVPIRARKANYLITRNFFITQLIIMLGCTQILLIFHLATPLTIGLVIVLNCLAQVVLNLFCIKSLSLKEIKNVSLG